MYPHDYPHGVSPAQQYLPDGASGAYYRPTGNGFEAQVSKRLQGFAPWVASKPRLWEVTVAR